MNEHTHPKFIAAFNTLVSSPLLWTSIMSKRKSYRKEDEIRLMVTGGKELFDGHVHTRPGDGARYINVDLPFGTKPILAGVTVGSLGDPRQAAQVRTFLRSRKLGLVPVVRSKVRPI